MAESFLRRLRKLSLAAACVLRITGMLLRLTLRVVFWAALLMSLSYAVWLKGFELVTISDVVRFMK